LPGSRAAPRLAEGEQQRRGGKETCDAHHSGWSASGLGWRDGLNALEGQMSKFPLLTACAFGLLFSPAYAQEKTLEQLREERAHIYGIEGQRSETVTRIVASGAKQQVGFYTSLNPDCTVSGDINVRVTKQPERGTVETAVKTEYVHYPKENIRSKCNQHRVKGVLVNYKAAEKYTGSDEFDLLVLFPHGTAWEIHYNITVR
jgi:hypothetical protein